MSVDLRWQLTGGAFAAVVLMAIVYLVGAASGAEARLLVEASLPPIRFFAAAVLTASATVLALMLTLLSLTSSMDKRFAPHHWTRISRIAAFASAAIIAGIVLLLVLGVPIAESARVPAAWYRWIYYGVMGLAAMVGGLLVSIVLMLYNAVQGIIELLREGSESRLTR